MGLRSRDPASCSQGVGEPGVGGDREAPDVACSTAAAALDADAITRPQQRPPTQLSQHQHQDPAGARSLAGEPQATQGARGAGNCSSPGQSPYFPLLF